MAKRRGLLPILDSIIGKSNALVWGLILVIILGIFLLAMILTLLAMLGFVPVPEEKPVEWGRATMEIYQCLT